MQPWDSLMYVVKLERDKWLQWVLFNMVGGQNEQEMHCGSKVRYFY